MVLLIVLCLKTDCHVLYKTRQTTASDPVVFDFEQIFTPSW